MTWDEVWKIVLGILASVGGISGLTLLAIKFSSNMIAERLSKKYDLKLSKELEKYKSSLDNNNLISRALFEKEFAIYQDLICKLYDAFPHLQLAYKMRQSGLKIIKRADINLYNPELNKMSQEVFQGKAVTEIVLDNEMKVFAENMFVFKTSIERSAAFMPLENRKLFTDIWDICWLFCCSKDEERKPEFEVVCGVIEIMNQNLNKYLKSLVITD